MPESDIDLETLHIELSRKDSLENQVFQIARQLKLPVTPEGVIDYQSDTIRCRMFGLTLNEDIAFGHFALRHPKDIYVAHPPLPESEFIVISINKGKMVIQHDNRAITESEGIINSVSLTNGMVHSEVYAERQVEFNMFVIRYSKKLLEKEFGVYDSFQKKIVQNSRGFMQYLCLDDKITRIVQGINDEDLPELTVAPFLIGKAYEILARTIDLLEGLSGMYLQITNEEYIKLQQASKFIISDWKNPPTIEQVSRFLGMSPTKSKLLFRQLFGEPVYTYFKNKRLEEALKRIKTGGGTISEIGHDLGFTNMSHFAESFKFKYGVLPKKLALSIRNESGLT